jgi:hypothetical protein
MCIGARERAYRRFRDAGDVRGCARAATSLAWDALLLGHGPAVARGWLGRAHELLADLDESPQHGRLAVREAEHALFLDHDPAAASEAADRAQGLGRRLAVTDLHVAGLALSGLARVSAGAVTEGMARLDTAVAAATAGDVASAGLSRLTGIPVAELDTHFWSPELTPLDSHAWIEMQRELAAAVQWIMDGDLGPYDVLAPRLARADTVLLLDFSLPRCVWNAARRSREHFDFWWWVLTWRVQHRRRILLEIRHHSPQAETVILRGPRDVAAFLAEVSAA